MDNRPPTKTVQPGAPERSYAGGERGDAVRWRDIRAFFVRALPVIALSTLATTTLGLVYCLTATPVFTARAQLLIDPKSSQAPREQASEVSFSLDNAQVESHIAVIRSEQIARLVIQRLGLLEDPEVVKGAPAPESDHADKPTTEREAAMRTALRGFLANLDVRRSGISYAIDIAYSSRDPDKSAQIANAVANAYVQNEIDIRRVAAREGSEWLEERITLLRRQMNVAARRVQQFKAGHDYSIGGRRIDAEVASHAPGSSGAPAPTPAATAPAKDETTTLEELESTALTYRKIFELYLQTYAEAVQRQSYPAAGARLISEAVRPSSRSRPVVSLILALAAVVGALAGSGIAVARQSLDQSVRTSEQAQDASHLPCLSMVPVHEAKGQRSVVERITDLRDGLRGRPVTSWLGPKPLPVVAADTVLVSPLARFSMAIKSINAQIGPKSAGRPARLIGFAGTEDGAGATVIASNLAALMAAGGLSVLVIDTRQARTYEGSGGATLRDALGGAGSVGDAIRRSSAGGGGYDRLAAGPAAGDVTSRAADVTLADGFAPLIGTLRDRYDAIVVLLEPVRALLDARRSLSPLDSLVLVAGWGRTSLSLLGECAEIVERAGVPSSGVVVNMCDSYSN